jgi:flagellar hook assembly protein FlgD
LVEISTTLITATTPRAPRLALRQNRPNPFNPSTAIEFSLGNAAWTTVAIFDVRGRLLRTLLDEFMPAGVHAVAWDGVDADGNRVGSGVYFCRLQAAGERRTMKMTLLK